MTKYRRLNITLPADLANKLDLAAAADFTTRSGYICEAVMQKIQAEEHVYDVFTDPQSYFNTMKQAHLSSSIRKRANQIKISEIPYSEL